jgi:hypothetical protein
MFPPKNLKNVSRGVRNLPADPVVDPNAPPPAADPDALTCPNCGTALSLQAIAKPATDQAPPTPAGAGAAAPPDTSFVSAQRV